MYVCMFVRYRNPHLWSDFAKNWHEGPLPPRECHERIKFWIGGPGGLFWPKSVNRVLGHSRKIVSRATPGTLASEE